MCVCIYVIVVLEVPLEVLFDRLQRAEYYELCLHNQNVALMLPSGERAECRLTFIPALGSVSDPGSSKISNRMNYFRLRLKCFTNDGNHVGCHFRSRTRVFFFSMYFIILIINLLY